MNEKACLWILTAAVVNVALISSAVGETLFLDDFEDGSVTDGMPVTWIPAGGDVLAVENGRMVVSDNGYAQATVGGLNLTNTSIRSRMRIRDGDLVGVAVRYDFRRPPGFRSYYAYAIPSIDEVGIGWGGDAVNVLDSASFDLGPTDEIFMQLDAIGDQVSLWVWRPGESMPSQPIASGTDTRVGSGTVFTYNGSEDLSNSLPAIAEYEFVHFARSSISSGPCDFNGDGYCGINDINTLLLEGPIAPGVPVTPGTNDQFDLTGDGVIDNADVDQWLADAATLNGFGSPYKRGDANLDGQVDVADFNDWNANKFTATLLWNDGNFNGDENADVGDFNQWNANKFTASDGIVTVPEPATAVLMIIQLAVTAVVVRRSTLGR